jgi:hypothetical protein
MHDGVFCTLFKLKHPQTELTDEGVCEILLLACFAMYRRVAVYYKGCLCSLLTNVLSGDHHRGHLDHRGRRGEEGGRREEVNPQRLLDEGEEPCGKD